MRLYGGGTGSGTFSGGEFQFERGTYTFLDGASCAGASMYVGGGALTIAGTVSFGGLTMPSGTLDGPGDLTVDSMDWSGGSIQGTGLVQVDGSLDIFGDHDLTFANGQIDIAGGATVFAYSGSIEASGGAVWKDLAGSTFVADSNVAYVEYSGATFNYAGEFDMSAAGMAATFEGDFDNTGTVDIQAGTLSIDGNYVQRFGSTNLQGNTLISTGGVDLQGGSLTGPGTIESDLTNAGQVSPGATGILTIMGNYAQDAAGSLDIDVGGLDSGTQFDQLNISGVATLAGTLNVGLVNGFEPNPDDTFPIMTFDSSSGEFINLPASFEPLYGENVLTLVAKAFTTTTIASDTNPSAYGQSVTFTATTSAVSETGTPTGTIQFAVDGTNYGPQVPLIDGSASLPTAPTYLTAGAQTITAVYIPDSTSDFAASDGSLTQTVSQVTPSFSDLSSPAITFGDNNDTVSGTISYAAASGTLIPTGSVDITVNGVSQSAPIDPTTGAFSSVFDTHAWPANPTGYTVTYHYAGDINFGSPADGSGGLVVNKAATTTTVASVSNVSVSGESVTFTATVTVNGPGSTTVVDPTGSVVFYVDGDPIGLGTLSIVDGQDQATFTTSSLTTASHVVWATYASGDSTFNASPDSAPINQVVNKAETTTSVTLAPEPSVYGQSVTFTATVTVNDPGSPAVANPGGTIQFQVDGVDKGDPVPMSGGSANLMIVSPGLDAGNHTITAVYSGDGNFTTSTSNEVIQEVDQAETTTTASTATNPSRLGQAVTFAVTVTSTPSEAGSPIGEVQLYDLLPGGGTRLLDEEPLLGGDANLTAQGLTVGIHSLMVVYVGGDNFLHSSYDLTQTVATLAAQGTTIQATEGAAVAGVIVATFSDGLGDGTPNRYSANIDWGDGTTSTASGAEGTIVSIGDNSFSVFGTRPADSPGYLEEGTYDVTVTVSDGNGASATATSTAQVADAPLQATGTTIGPVTGARFSGVVASFTDANPSAKISDYNAQIVWGDGHSTTGTIQADAFIGGFDVLGSNTYASKGTYTITVTVNDVGGSSAQATSTALVGGYTPEQIRHAYGFDQIRFAGPEGQAIPGDGSGQTIAIVDAYDDPGFVDSTDPGFNASDLAQFDKKFGLADPPSFIKLGQDGTTNLPGADPTGVWEEEEALDVEWAHAIAPAAKIILIETNADPTNLSQSFKDLFAGVVTAASQPGVSVVSMSWGYPESFFGQSAEQNYDASVFAAHPGVTYLAASGDNGAPGLYPASSPFVVAVGGTSLFLNADDSYQQEQGWPGSGGGVSPFESEPAYQDGVQGTGFRNIPDVAYDADPSTGFAVFNSTGGGAWSVVGGTSAGTPQWAALTAIVNQGLASDGKAPLDGPTQTLPGLYGLPSGDFHDITTGNNGFAAGPGYDLVTGLGSPIANRVVADLVNAYTLSAAGATVNAVEGQPFQGTAATFAVADPAGVTGRFTASIDWGDNSQSSNGTVSFNSATDLFVVSGSHTYAEAGNSRVTVTIQDTRGNTVVVVSQAVVADAPLTDTTPSHNNITVPGVGNRSTGTIVLATFTDGNPGASASDFVVSVAWYGAIPSSTSDSVQFVSASATYSSWEVVGGATYAGPGAYPVSVTVSDEDSNSNTFIDTNTTITINFPAPALASISPDRVAVGYASPLTLTVNGSGFVSQSVIDWNATALTTTYVSSDELTALIPASDFASAGNAGITVTNPAPGGGTSAGATFQVVAVPSTVDVNAAWAGDAPGTAVTWADGSTHAVGFDAFGTIQAAVDAVAVGGTVNVAPGTYNEAVTIGQSLTLTGAAQGSVTSVLDGSRVDSSTAGIVIESDGVTISDLTIQSFHGPGIDVARGTVTINGCTLVHNSAFDGAGILNYGNLTVNHSIIEDNSVGSNGGGGGIDNEAILTVTNSTIVGNTGAAGGGILNDAHGTVTVSDSTIVDNTGVGGLGGGIYNNSGTMTVSGSTVSNNSATNGGGGIFNNNGSLMITSTTVADNSGADGGGVLNDGGTVTVTNDTLNGDSASDGGGGLANLVGTMMVTNATIADNSANYGGGIWDYGNGTIMVLNCTITDNQASSVGRGGGLNLGEGPATLDNTIVALNTDGTGSGAPADDIALHYLLNFVAGTISPTSAYNLIGTGGSGGLTDGINGNRVGVANPGLGTLTSNGGPTQTIALLPGSPAIDAGSNVLAVDAQGNPLASDQRGLGFPRIVDGVVDIGAFEYHSFSVSSVSAVSPNPRNTPVSIVIVTFSEPVDLGSFTTNNLILSDNGGSDLITSAVTISLVSDSTYQIGGLASLTSGQGNYALTINAAGIHDQFGDTGTGSLSTSWLMVTTPPASTVSPLPEVESRLSFSITVTGTVPTEPAGSPTVDIASFAVYVSTNGGAWTPWQTLTPATGAPNTASATFNGTSNAVYAFYSVATDNVGNTQVYQPAVEASTELPNLNTPATQVTSSSAYDANGTFTLDLAGTDAGGNGLAYFAVFVAVDAQPPVPVGPAIPAGVADGTGTYHATISYGIPFADYGASHTYRFFSTGIDAAGLEEAVHAAPNDVSFSASYSEPAESQLAVAGLTVEHGAAERSYIRYLDLIFNDANPSLLQAVVNSVKNPTVSNPAELTLTQNNLTGTGTATPVPLQGLLQVIDDAIEIDFGTGGIGGNPGATAADGYYTLTFAPPSGQGMGSTHHFDRLLGDVNGDGTVDQNDLNEIAAARGQSMSQIAAAMGQPATSLTPLSPDVNGDGSVNTTDLAVATRSRGQKLGSGLTLG